MPYTILTPRKSLNKAYLKVKPNRNDIDHFKKQLSSLLEQIKEGESEEFHKNIIGDFLKKTYYDPDYYINTKGRNDQVIHNGKNTKSSVGVIIEAKSPTNQSQMPSKEKIDSKAMQELVLYFLRERITQKNTEVRHLVITNIHEWFIFDAHVFDSLFAKDKKLVHKFEEFEAKALSATDTEHFYKEIAKPAIEAAADQISFTYFNVKDYEKALKSGKEDDTKLIVLYKLLSPEHLLKLPFANDSNSLDKGFYNELLYIMGLEEFQEKGKKLIQRKPEKERIYGTLLESVISKLESRGELHRLDNPQQYGKNTEERLFNVGLQLVITWLNRILFLKLLEAQLLDYNNGDQSYAFLNLKRIGNFNKLADLFFNVLAVPTDKRKPAFQEAFAKVPYLNSSLFEANELENRALHIDTLDASEQIPISGNTVLKDIKGKKRKGELPVLEYLFAFLEAYDFSSEGSEEIQEENKTLINASVLGLIFEKINGYKDGSFFTPGFITMYMCRETIRRAVVEKFNSHYGWKCKDFSELKEDLHEEIKQSEKGRKAVRTEANTLINSLKICDPAVGSGHFLVSALNELIAIKHELSILIDAKGDPLSDYQITIENDELIITDLEDRLFSYQPTHDNSQRMQKALFHEKQELIENCLFGVDLNPNSVKICRLRLWIELLKSAYYKESDDEIRELETLPNIDINIKVGNSLISRFGLEEDLSKALKKSKWNISTYRNAVDSYRNAASKDEKREMERLIQDIKSDFRTEINKNDPKIKRKAKLAGELYNLTMQQGLFEESKSEQKERKKQIDKLEKDLNKLETDIEEIKSNAIYENAFEWRFEFPEILDDEGNFVGFDVVIGNPPYILVQTLGDSELFRNYNQSYITAAYKIDTYALFYELGLKVLSDRGILNYITPNTFLKNKHSVELRKLLLNYSLIEIINFQIQVFDDASVDTLILLIKKSVTDSNVFDFKNFNDHRAQLEEIKKISHVQNDFKTEGFELELDLNDALRSFLNKLSERSKPLIDYGRSYFGIQTFDRKKYVNNIKVNENYYPVIDGGNVKRYFYEKSSEFVEFTKESIKSGGDINVYKKHRIAVRQIGRYPEGTIIPPYTMTLNTIYNIFLYEENRPLLLYILALLNSKVLQFFWLKKHYDNKATFPKIKKAPIESIPIAEPASQSIEVISDLVEKIFEIKKQDATAETTYLEQEIDKMVYELYGLTEEEIKIVEGGVG
ncbi:TaqI-like C-terminal specificity domain-containing protein [Marivirga arenosa]|uniref:site-specific DNA-methyltransferase (adenine-specific) n=1 Tax=Marivirga arenosa TaxID=3059076 RepID=A0AA51N606_9BACT|nr:TaqI-like C-terminal specificity domain-containing protein [Marivirga sp. ABR2-2]WMN06897.1 TaqI-like C-terminal specificity domain-containing protein [Marivirga sp. ABR2-2]